MSRRGRYRGSLVAAALLSAAAAVLSAAAAAAPAPRPSVDRFDEQRAFAFVERQVALGPRPAGSHASRVLAGMLRAALPGARYQAVPGRLRNVVARVPGRDPTRVVVVGAHYDTKDLPHFVGANDGASGTAVALELARTIRPRSLRPSLVFVFFDGEESAGEAQDVTGHGLRGSKIASRVFRNAEAMILLDFVGDRELSLPREGNSDRELWARLRRAAQRVGVASVFPARSAGTVVDDHLPFLRQGVPAIDLIDFDFACWHLACDDLTAVSARSLDAVGETVLELLRSY